MARQQLRLTPTATLLTGRPVGATVIYGTGVWLSTLEALLLEYATMTDSDQLQRLESRLADLRARMPAHSARPSMLMELEDLEEEIVRLRAELSQKGGHDAQGSSQP